LAEFVNKLGYFGMSHWATTSLLVAFMGFIGFRRFRRLRRRREMRPIRPIRFVVRMVVLGAAVVALTMLPVASPTILAGGLTLGLALGLYSLRLTSYEPGVKGAMYMPHPQVGIILFTLFLVRVSWRLSRRLLYDEPMWNRFGEESSGGTPWTLLLILVLVGYALTFTIGVMIRGRSIPKLPETATEISGGSAGG